MNQPLPLRILIADDDPDDLQYWKFIFDSNKNFQIIECVTNGSAIVQHIAEAEHAPDILLTDMYMPMLTGVEVLKQLAARDLAQGMKTFIISTTINVDEEQNLQHNANVKFLEKPISLAQINDLPGVILSHLNIPDENRI